MITDSPHQIGSMMGGISPPANKKQSTGSPIGIPPLPKILVLPLSQSSKATVDPIIKVGDKVLKGQMIARDSAFMSSTLHAPTSGIITAIRNHPTAFDLQGNTLCIFLKPDGKDKWCELHPITDYEQLSHKAMVQKVYNAGILGMGGAGFPTTIKLSSNQNIKTLILNGTECEPYITADDMLMRSKTESIITGAKILQSILGATQCLIGIEDNKPEAINAIAKAAEKTNIETVVLPTLYPSGSEKQLIKIITGHEVPSGKNPSDIGIIVQNVSTVVAIQEAVVEGKPLISRITTLTGNALQKPQNAEVLIGTLAQDLLKFAELQPSDLSQVIFGGSMTGFSVDRLDIPVIKTSNCLIAATQDEFPPASMEHPCIRCGHCADVCPSSLLPQQLYRYAKADNHDQLIHHNLLDCIECGACSFVCPSSIPLVQYYRTAKESIQIQATKQAKSSQYKQRYENRLARLENEKSEKTARKKFNAERLAQRKASQKEQSGNNRPIKKDDPILAAITRSQARKQSTVHATNTNTINIALSDKQKKLKIQLNMVKSQAKMTENALAAAEASSDQKVDNATIEHLRSNLVMLNNQVAKLQQNFAEVSEPPSSQEHNTEATDHSSETPFSDFKK